MIRINLLPVREARRAANMRRHGLFLGGTVLAAGLVCIGLHVSISSSISVERHQMQVARAELSKLEMAQKQVEGFRREKEAIEQKLGVIHRLEAGRQGPVRMMDEIASRIPEKLWLRELELRAGQLKLRGTSLDNEVVAEFMTRLERSPMIAGVELKQTRLNEQKGLKLVDFEIETRPVVPAGATPAAG